MALNEREAWAAFRRRPDEAAFEPVYERTRALVYTICRRILGAGEDCEDAFQSTYRRLFESARLAEPPEANGAAATLARLAVREADALRKRRGRRRRKEVVMETAPETAAPEATPAGAAQRRQARERLEALVGALPERYRLPVQLHYFHGLSYREIGEALDRPAPTVSSQISRALKKLEGPARGAGLDSAAAALSAVAPGGGLIEPPAALTAGKIAAGALAGPNLLAQLKAVGGAATAGGAALGAAKAKWAAMLGFAAIAIAAPVTYRLTRDAAAEPDAPSGAVTPAPPVERNTFRLARGDQVTVGGLRIRLVRVETNDPDDPDDDSVELSIVSAGRASQLVLREGDTLFFENYQIHCVSADPASAEPGAPGSGRRRGEGAGEFTIRPVPPPLVRPIG